MHTFAKVALAAAIGIASAQASAVSVDIDESPLNIEFTGQYIATGDNIPGSFEVNILNDLVSSVWDFSWNPGIGVNSNAVQFTLQQGATIVASASAYVPEMQGRSQLTTGELLEGSYIMYMSVVGGDSSSYGFSADVTATVLGDDVTPVPLPAAAWLFISGIAGYAGVSLKKKKKAA